MAKTAKHVSTDSLELLIFVLRDQRIILDADLARLYGVSTGRFNEAVKRNIGRFPLDFAFQLKSDEFKNLISQNAISSSERPHGGTRKKPWAFTEHGALMAANILKSERAIQMSVFVVRAFVKLREQVAANTTILRRLAEIDKTLLLHDKELGNLYRKLLSLLQPSPLPPKRRIGFQIED